jgi:hypothetical protein
MTELRPFVLVRSIRRYLLFAQSAGVVSIAVGALVLVGWAFDIAVLKSVVPGMTRMKPNTAVCFILLGAALWLFRKKPAQSESVHPRRQVVAQACALLAALIGSVTLVEYLFGFDAGIDKLLFRNALLATKVPFPGRMAHVTGLEFIVLGIALALLNAESLRGQRLSRIFAVVGTLIGLIAIVGYAYGAEELYKISTFSSVALHTALLSTLLGFAILCARADQGFLSTIISTNLGGSIARRILPMALTFPFLIGWLRLQGQHAGLYGTEFGLAIFTISNVLIFAILVCLGSQSLNRQMRRASDLQWNYGDPTSNCVSNRVC